MKKDNLNHLSVKDQIIYIVWTFVSRARSYRNSLESIFPVFYVLYGIHKRYKAIKGHGEVIRFKCDDIYDELLNSLYELSPSSILDMPLYRLYDELQKYSYDVYEENYVEVIQGLIQNISINNGNKNGDFYTPSELSSLICYFIKEANCHSVYDPFCGTASIVHNLPSENFFFRGQDINVHISLMARINNEAHYKKDEGITCDDSIFSWDSSSFDAVVSCPPFGLKLSPDDRVKIDFSTEKFDHNLEEIIYSRSFNHNRAKLVITLAPLSVCHSLQYSNFRRFLVDNNYLDKLILLPPNLLFGTSVPCVLLISKRERKDNEYISFINAENFNFQVFKYGSVFDLESFIDQYEKNIDSIRACVDPLLIKDYNYNLIPSLFFHWNPKLEEGQTVVSVGDLISVVKEARLTPPAITNYVRNDLFRYSFIDVILNVNKVKIIQTGPTTALKSYDHILGSYLLVLEMPGSGRKYYLHNSDEGFSCVRGVKVMKINENLVTPEYLVYLFTNNPVLKKSIGSITDYLNYKIVIDGIDAQKELINKLNAEHAAKIQQEYEADKKRLGVKQNISDLEHLLQTTQANIDSMIYDLEELYPEDKNYHCLVKGVKDNLEYMKRVIRFSNTTISSDMFYLRQHDIDDFVKDYCGAWKNFSGNYFNLELRSNLGDSNKVVFDKTYLKLMLDSILTNVERHGFNKHRSEENIVEISLSLEKFEEKAYVVLRVANNGEPFKKGFTINDYITRGRYSAKTGRSGLGGYHVYQIAKGHNGFLYLDSNKIWNVIVEVLLPIENVEIDNLPIYEHECI